MLAALTITRTYNPSLLDIPQDEVKRYGLQALTYGSLTEKELDLHVSHVDGFDLGCGDGVTLI